MNAPEYASDRDYYSWLNGSEERPEEEQSFAGVGVDGDTQACASDGTDCSVGNGGATLLNTRPFGEAFGVSGSRYPTGGGARIDPNPTSAHVNSRVRTGTPAPKRFVPSAEEAPF